MLKINKGHFTTLFEKSLSSNNSPKKNKTIPNLPKIQDALKRNKMKVGWLWPFTSP
jgi:hypothetical protein